MAAQAEAAFREADVGAMRARLAAEVRSTYARIYALDRERTALDAANRSGILHEAHALKGSSAQVGAEAMSGACREMEALAPSAPLEELKALVDRAEGQFVEVREAILQTYGE